MCLPLHQTVESVPKKTIDIQLQNQSGVSIHQWFECPYQEKQILSVDHTGCLSVNSIRLNGGLLSSNGTDLLWNENSV